MGQSHTKTETTGNFDEENFDEGNPEEGNYEMPPWMLALPDKERAEAYVIERITPIFLKIICSGDLADGAKRIHARYRDEYLPADSDRELLDCRSMRSFFKGFYKGVFLAARAIPHTNPGQERLVQLIIELRNLLSKLYKLDDGDVPYSLLQRLVMVPESNSILQEIALECGEEFPFYNNLRLEYNRKRPSGDSDREDVRKWCEEWLNVSAFCARCIRSNLIKHYTGTCLTSFLDDIPGGPGEGHWGDHAEAMRKTFLLVAVQYVLLAGPEIYRAWVEEDSECADGGTEAREKWRLWAKKIKEYEENEPGYSRDGSYARQALGKMISLDPGLRDELYTT